MIRASSKYPAAIIAAIAVIAFALPAWSQTMTDKCATMAPAIVKAAKGMREIEKATAETDMAEAASYFDGAAATALNRAEMSRKALLPLLDDYVSSLEIAASVMQSCASPSP